MSGVRPRHSTPFSLFGLPRASSHPFHSHSHGHSWTLTLTGPRAHTQQARAAQLWEPCTEVPGQART